MSAVWQKTAIRLNSAVQKRLLAKISRSVWFPSRSRSKALADLKWFPCIVRSSGCGLGAKNSFEWISSCTSRGLCVSHVVVIVNSSDFTQLWKGGGVVRTRTLAAKTRVERFTTIPRVRMLESVNFEYMCAVFLDFKCLPCKTTETRFVSLVLSHLHDKRR